MKQISDYEWEIEKKENMNVPGRVFADETLLKKMQQDRTLQQGKNIASLPGIYKYSIVLPDGHQGYGFPIGGVAALDYKEGGISPGGIGYDINCLTGDSKVLLEFGRNRPIKTLKEFTGENAVVVSNRSVKSNIQLFIAKEGTEVFEVKTATGERIRATKDHPFLTEHGMERLEALSEGSHVYIRPFKGIRDENPKEFAVLTEKDFEGEDPQLINVLKERDVLPLKSTDRTFNILLKLVGFHTGDGSFNNHSQTSFYGKKEDLKSIQQDIKELGFKPSRIYSRKRKYRIKGKKFERIEHHVKSTSNAFQKLLIKLGAPKGKKTRVNFTTPPYLKLLTNWQKALYLSAFFGAEMTSPKAQNNKDFCCPKISQNKAYASRESGKIFMLEIKKYLEDLGIKTNKIECFETTKNRDGRVIRYRLGIKNDYRNLIKFFTEISYRYNLEKQKKAVEVIQYLKLKQIAIQRREEIAERCVKLYTDGSQACVIKQQFDINNRFIKRSIYEGRKTRPRSPANFPDFEEFSRSLEVKDNLSVRTTIKSITNIGQETVYDIGIAHEAHNFVANEFVVSNCGVRLVKTNLSIQDVRGKIKELLNNMYNKVPSGVGRGSNIKLSKYDLKNVLEKGSKWALEQGYAKKDDLEVTEEHGCMDTEASMISNKALNRGVKQVGCLGAGNHFLEIQAVDNILDKRGKRFGIEKEGQVCVMIHTGSRGYGHQVCTDYLRTMEKKYKDLVKKLPDRELVYAPAGSELCEEYFKAMKTAANFAWCNRQVILHQVRKSFDQIFDDVKLDMIYDVAHNIAKVEKHNINGEKKKTYVHRKGATRAFPKGHEAVPGRYRDIGQPVIIPGSMGTASYLLTGCDEVMDKTFGSTAHGAGRVMSRTKARKKYWGQTVAKEMERQQGIIVKAQSFKVVAEEAAGAYKDIDRVTEITEKAGISDRLVRLVPLGVVKG